MLSVPSRFTIGSRLSKSPMRLRMTSSTRCARRTSRGSGCRSGGTRIRSRADAARVRKQPSRWLFRALPGACMLCAVHLRLDLAPGWLRHPSQSATWLFVALMLGGIPVLHAQATTLPVPEPHVYAPAEVDVPAKVIDDGIAPHYPDALRPLGLGGIVIAQFVIDTSGRADTTSVLTDGSNQPLFIAAVHEALARMHFTPARKGGA